MNFNYPVFAIALSGNKRDDAAKIEFVCFASYQKRVDKTMIFVRVEKLSRASRRETQRDLSSIFSKIGQVESCVYFENGAEVVMLSDN